MAQIWTDWLPYPYLFTLWLSRNPSKSGQSSTMMTNLSNSHEIWNFSPLCVALGNISVPCDFVEICPILCHPALRWPICPIALKFETFPRFGSILATFLYPVNFSKSEMECDVFAGKVNESSLTAHLFIAISTAAGGTMMCINFERDNQGGDSWLLALLYLPYLGVYMKVNGMGVYMEVQGMMPLLIGCEQLENRVEYRAILEGWPGWHGLDAVLKLRAGTNCFWWFMTLSLINL